MDWIEKGRRVDWIMDADVVDDDELTVMESAGVGAAVLDSVVLGNSVNTESNAPTSPGGTSK